MQPLPERWRALKNRQIYMGPRSQQAPLRAELFSAEQLIRHAKDLAATHRLVAERGGSPLLERLSYNEAILQDFNHSAQSVEPGMRITPAAEWLLDNFYLIEEQIQLARRHLPRNYSRELPCLANAESAGLPRVYDIVVELISHLDAQIDAEPLTAFIASYQTVDTLKMGELWAIPIMLRLGLIENLQRITTRLLVAGVDRDHADSWVDRLQEMAETNPSHLVVVVADMAKADLPVSSAFVTQFTERLSRQSPVLHLARGWLEQHLIEQGLSIEQLVHQESQSQAFNQISVSYSIGSLRFLTAMDWKEFVETLSVVEEALRTDPSGIYRKMDFVTRDNYRHSVEKIAKHGKFTESQVALKAVQLASENARNHGRADRTAHVGFYLIGKGLSTLERTADFKPPWNTTLEKGIHRFPFLFFAGGVGLLVSLAGFAFLNFLLGLGMQVAGIVLFTLIFVIGVSQLAVATMNGLATLLVKPRALPRLNFSCGIVTENRTMVVVPTLLTDKEGVRRLIETLELHHLSNTDSHLHFALLSDFIDAPEEVMLGDELLLQEAREGIEMLNAKYADGKSALFFLFHRPRRWNPCEERWMGYERKRGKLAEFNALLRGGSRDRFSEVVGETSILPGIKYVITLDTDTQLPRDVARMLVATMAHPLNQPSFDPVSGIVTEGYGILQPRVGVSLPSARRSWFVRLFAGDAGIDPYTREVSDVYQDIFKEGSFVGKGIYDVDAFEHALGGRFPENVILSHDLLEGCHARSGLVSDVEFYEEFPARYNVDIARRHRWIRGDWQIVGWLMPRVPSAKARRSANPLSRLSMWKIFDNLRRSLVPIALLLIVIGAWLIFPDNGSLGSLLVVIILAAPCISSSLLRLFSKPDDLPWGLYLRGEATESVRLTAQVSLAFALLPYDAFVSLDAIGRTLLRLLLTRKRLLEWQTSSDSERTNGNGLSGYYITMWAAPGVALGVGLLLGITRSPQFSLALPILLLWFGSPCIAWWISQPIAPTTPDLSSEQSTFLRRVARKTWYFFETFVTAEENWLPPDNFQEDPVPKIASRTSPTNMGLALLANLAARDFGYLTMGGLIRRTRDAFATMHTMQTDRGHFYNWYDTRTLQPLHPIYISSVDSGNLAGHLLTLGSGLRGLADEPVCPNQVFAGLRDTVGVLKELAGEHVALSELEAELEQVPSTLLASHDLLERALRIASKIAAFFAKDAEELQIWSQILQRSCEVHLEELNQFAPWLAMSDGPDQSLVARGRANFSQQLTRLDRVPTLRELAGMEESSEPCFDNMRPARDLARLRMSELETLAQQSDAMGAMDFAFLYDQGRDLFMTGFNVSECRNDAGYYDLLASEARLCSYVAIALGQIPQDHWFSMGRLLVAAHSDPILVSWSGSMFEYLMPLLVMPNYENTLLDHSCRGSVKQQIEYGRRRSVPWGISESGYNRTDVQMNYQYRAFGVPGLGLKRGLADDLVIAPYASVMALMLAPREACDNLQRLSKEGREGAFGFYEAIDYTPSRLPPDEKSATILSYMAHHQGMSLLALLSLLRDAPMQKRFMACPQLKAAGLLLQERVPRTTASVYTEGLQLEESHLLEGEGAAVMRVITNPTPSVPEVHLLSNGRYHLVISSAGGGYSRWMDLAVTRWREDATRDCWGTFVYLRDVESGEFWSTAFQPTGRGTKGYEAIFSQARAEFRQRHAGIEAHTEICISPEDDVEVRRITLTNRSSMVRTIELTSYAEIVLARPADEVAHPAFSNLFVQTEFARESSAVLCSRRARSQDEEPPWLLHLMVGQGGEQGPASCETDRSKFVGRGRSLANPAAMREVSPLSNTVGSVLDPIISLRRTVTLAPNEIATVNLVVGVTKSRESALDHVEQYQSARMSERAFDLAWTHSQVTLHHLNISEAEAQLYGRFASALIYADVARRAGPAVLRKNRRGQTGLWSYGISGDDPIVMLRISDSEKIEIVRQVIRAHSYWRMKGLAVELVILNEDVSVYRQSLQDEITNLISSGIEAQMLDQRGGIFVRRLEQVPHEDLTLLESVARIVLSDEKGSLMQQLERRGAMELMVPALVASSAASPAELPLSLPKRDLMFSNGLGGFTRDGHEYVITLQAGQVTPAPWVNVLANPHFGTVISESGSAYTWVENAHEFRLTPWNNDPVEDITGEAFYIRDEQTGQFWSPTPSPARGATPYVVRHGFGYSVFEHTENGIRSELWIYVALDASVKFAILKVKNISGRPRRLSATGYWEWVLGDLRHKSLMHVQTEVDLKTGALLAINTYNSDFLGRIAFLDVNDESRTLTGSRKEFIGRNGSLSAPAALKRTRLSGKVGAGLDPCGAIQVTFDLHDGQEREVSFRLGVGRDKDDVNHLIQRFRRADSSRIALEAVWEYWNRTLGTINVDTPDPAVNAMANGWLLYQTLSSRIWGRTGFYQSGGGFGFRDQLQDVMALLHAEPALARSHLLVAAAHQFVEGDVQHWWHPPAGRGVRTHFSDDYLWLPFVTSRYVTCVGDAGVLDELVSFLEGRPVKPDEEAYYDLPSRSEEVGTLYEHCVRSIERGLNFGEHGLPLMGCGDWNDGMNRVGHEGRGESVWLAFFLYDVLTQFSVIADLRGDRVFSDRCILQAARLQQNIEENAWDGEWYRRAYFDNGEALGSSESPECQIDSLPQSWSVLSGAGDPSRSEQAMESVDRRLVRREAGLVQLFDPPFDKSHLNPGYIKGYIPGVRENGGQYTHAAIWVAMAFARMGKTERAWEIFNLLNPIHHGSNPAQVATYKVEPYVVAADVYGVSPHVGRGGWTWYTGSAGWMYRLLVETLLGIHRKGDHLVITPRMPAAWTAYKVHYRYLQTVYHITITRLSADSSEARPDAETKMLLLVNDHQEHFVEMKFP